MGVYHAKLSPSGSKVWTDCTASPGAQEGRPSTTSDASRMGTTGHQIGEECLTTGDDPMGYVGRTLTFLTDRREVWEEDLTDEMFPLVFAQEKVTPELAEAAAKYVGYVRNLHNIIGGDLIVEQPVPIDHITGEEGATGMSDAIILSEPVLYTIDAKFGRKKVYAYEIIEAESYDLVTGDIIPPKYRINLQLGMYLLGSLEKYGLLYEFKKVKGVIVQPFLNHVSEYECTVEELLELKAWLSERAEATRTNPEFKPSHENCFFCKAKYDCHARNRVALEAALDGFDDIETARPKPVTIPQLGDLYSKLSMIRSWCDDIEERTLNELMAGNRVATSSGVKLKLVEGKKVNKEWDNPELVEKMMHDMRIKADVMYTKKLVTPSQAEKLADVRKTKKASESAVEKPIGKIKWGKLLPHIRQPDGKPVIALQTDPRPVYVKKDDGFGDVDSTQSGSSQ